MPTDDDYIRRAIRLAMNGRGAVEPNPMVGCVIVKAGRVIGEGYHQRYGGPHAEPNALASCIESPAGATAYVTLEPCSHLKKQTPPCAPLLIREKIARVVVGCVDPNPDVNGNGVRMLREAGIVVDISSLEADCKQLIAPFISRVGRKMPYVTAKWAETSDGFVAGVGRVPVRISSPRSSRLVHRLRADSDAIMVGVGTVMADDPMLTARDVSRVRPTIRYVMDRHLRTPLSSKLVKTARNLPVVIGCHPYQLGTSKAQSLTDAGVVLYPAPFAARAMIDLFTRAPATHVLVEPGPTLAGALFVDNLIDRLWVIRSASRLGEGIGAAVIPTDFVNLGSLDLDGDVLTEYLNTRSSVCFAPVPSADFVLAGDRPLGASELPDR